MVSHHNSASPQNGDTQGKQLPPPSDAIANTPAIIDIDALKCFTKSRTNETEYRKKIRNSQSRLKIYRFYSKKEECTSTCSLLKNFETLRPKFTVSI